jgi:hypothetical protein
MTTGFVRVGDKPEPRHRFVRVGDKPEPRHRFVRLSSP